MGDLVRLLRRCMHSGAPWVILGGPDSTAGHFSIGRLKISAQLDTLLYRAAFCLQNASMSRVRTRPTRDDTREKLFEAAVQVFEEQGIGGASIEAMIAAAAGYTRGAFYYSNFKSKDELIFAMLEDHVEQSDQAMSRPARHRSTKNLRRFPRGTPHHGSQPAGSAQPVAAAAHGEDPDPVRRARREAATGTRQAAARPAAS